MASKKRTPDQLKKDRVRISELMLKQHTHGEIAEIVYEETGIELTRRQISYDVTGIRKAWLTRQRENYDVMVTEELYRLDILERELWRSLRASADPKIKEIIEKHMIKGDVEIGTEASLQVRKMTEHIDKTGINPTFFDQIMRVQQERRKLLGLYAPTVSLERIEKKVVVKGYREVSPSDWPDAIEGEIIRRELKE